MGSIVDFFTRKKDRAIMEEYTQLLRQRDTLTQRYATLISGSNEERKKGNTTLARKLHQGAEGLSHQIESAEFTLNAFRERNKKALTRETQRMRSPPQNSLRSRTRVRRRAA